MSPSFLTYKRRNSAFLRQQAEDEERECAQGAGLGSWEIARRDSRELLFPPPPRTPKSHRDGDFEVLGWVLFLPSLEWLPDLSNHMIRISLFS